MNFIGHAAIEWLNECRGILMVFQIAAYDIFEKAVGPCALHNFTTCAANYNNH